MSIGALAYIVGRALPFSPTAKGEIMEVVTLLQPILLFVMLYCAFCKVNPRDMRPHRWHFWLLLTQCMIFVSACLIMKYINAVSAPWQSFFLEGLLLSIICPTATACAVITQKLGGDSSTTTTYTLFINLAVAVIAPLMLPLISPQGDLTFFAAFFTISKKVFPLLIFPLLLAWATRYFLPRLHKMILSVRDLAFYLWLVALAIAIAITCRALWHSNATYDDVIAIAAATLMMCLFQFVFGKWVGGKYHQTIEAGQAMGQKNTIFMIWLGYTYLSPLSATAGGFYSIWHNIVNSYQLYKKRH
ncbi:MAG: transporter [Prevotella sp.]|nr:transporter [Prevotella sp.]